MSEKVGWRAGRSTVWLAGWLTDWWAGRLGVVLMLLLLPLVLLGPLLIPLLLLWLRLPLSLFVACRPSLFRCRDQPVE